MRTRTTAGNYSFGKSYYDNFKANRIRGIILGAMVKRVITRNYVVATYTSYSTDTYEAVNIKDYVKHVYNGDSPDCILDKVQKTLSKAWEDRADAINDAGDDIVDEVQRWFS